MVALIFSVVISGLIIASVIHDAKRRCYENDIIPVDSSYNREIERLMKRITYLEGARDGLKIQKEKMNG